jgi:hypothetical protein
MYEQWQAAEEQILIMDAKKRAARQAEDIAYQTAAAEVGDLIETLYHYFNDDPAILAQLGLRRRQYHGPKKKVVKAPPAPTPVAADKSATDSADKPAADSAEKPAADSTASTTAETSTTAPAASQPTANRKPKSDHQTRAQLAADWQRLCANVQKLEQPALDLIANQEWALARCAAAAALVETMIQADQTQQAAISAYHSQVDQARDDRIALYGWYWPIAKLAKRAIRKLPQEKRVQYESLLGF